MTPVIIPDAQDEINNALAVSRDAARFRAAIEDALATIGANPQIAARIGRSRFRRYIFTDFPYSIIYAVLGDEVRVIAFPHSSRKPGYWKHRLP